jgi:hypothetical protein
MYLDDNHRWYIYGLTSFVVEDDITKGCNISMPTYFASVPRASKWLAESIRLANSAYSLKLSVEKQLVIIFIFLLIIY